MDTVRNLRWGLAALAVPALLVACGEGGETSSATSTAPSSTAPPPRPEARAALAAADGAPVGNVTFTSVPGGTEVDVQLNPNKSVTAGRFHGIHVHANDDPANGEGCKAEPAAPPASWFIEVDGHMRQGTGTHSDHAGDLPSLLVRKDGSASLRFITDRFNAGEVLGKAVIVHSGADNFGNIPVGALPDQYSANAREATTKTAATGNAGDRVACGLIARP